MKKVFISLLAALSVAACGSAKKTTKKTKTESKEQWTKYPLNRVGYITEMSDNAEYNYIKKYLVENKEKYKYRFDGTEDAAYQTKPSTTRVYNTDNAKEFKAAFKVLDQNNVGLVFVENKQDDKGIDKLEKEKNGKVQIDLWKEIMEHKRFKGKMVLLGKGSKYYYYPEQTEISKKKKEWKADNIATFEFSEIISAYYLGYRTQYNFGLDKDGNKKSVGYILGATYETSTNKKKNIQKAVAFRAGVEAAEKELKTGPASFVLKNEVSDDKDDRSLVRLASDLEEVAKKMGQSSNYKDKDFSIVYFAGAPSVYNETIAGALEGTKVKNKWGHILIGEGGSTTKGYILESSNDINFMKSTTKDDDEDTETINYPKSVTARIAMFYDKENRAAEIDTYNLQVANKYAMEKVLEMIFKDDSIANYFGKHTYIGTFGLIIEPGEYGVPEDQAPTRVFGDEMKKKLIDKKLTEEQFKTKADWLGSDE